MAYERLTLADLLVALESRTDTARFWTTEEARLAINETFRLWNLFTGKWRQQVAYDAIAGQHEYDLGASLTYSMGVQVQGRPLLLSSLLDLTLGRPSWRTETTAFGGDVPTRSRVWAPVSLQQIAIWPAPETSVVGAITVSGVAATPILEEDADTVDLGDEHLDVLLDEALHILTFKQGGPLWEGTMAFDRAFLEAAINENGRLKSQQAFRRAAGLDRRRDLQPTKGIPTLLDAFVEER